MNRVSFPEAGAYSPIQSVVLGLMMPLQLAVTVPPELTVLGLALMVAPWTERIVVAVRLRLPLVPVTVIVELPVGVVDDVVTVIVDVVVVGFGLKLAPAPAGVPLALSWTAPLNVLLGATVTV